MKTLTMTLLLFSHFTFAQAGCEKNFDDFLSSISENRNIQEKFISYPLKYIYIDLQSPEMPLVEKKLSEKDIKTTEFSIYPLKSRQKHHGLVHKIIDKNATSAKVDVFKPETDYLLTFTFQIKSDCWFLVEYIDSSL